MSANLLTAVLVLAQAFAAVHGTVVRAGTDSSISGAQIVLIGQGLARSSLMTMSDEAGKFSFDHIPPGEYRLIATAEGTVNNSASRSGARPMGQSITLREGQELKNIVLPLTPYGGINGHLFGRSGDPMVNVEVQALRYSYRNQVRELSVEAAGRTNNAGEFRIDKLPPGSYMVRTAGLTLSATPRSPVSPASGSVQSLVYSYFPAGITSETATRIGVLAGGTYTGVDWTVLPPSSIHIRGKAINGLTGLPLHITSASIVLRDSDNQTVATTATGNDGKFEIRSVSPGSYILSASISGSDETQDRRVAARMRIDAGDNDIDDLLLLLQPGFTIAGRIVFSDGTIPAADNAFGKMRIELRTVPWQPQLSSNFPYGPSRPREDGTFTLPGVLPGTYHLSITGTPANQYVKSARFGSAEALDSAIQFDPVSDNLLEIVIGTTAALLEATVLDAGQSPASNATVVLVPDPPYRDRLDIYRDGASDGSGRVRISGLVPGKYKVFALEGLEPGAWFDPEFLRLYENRGRTVELEEGKSETIKLTLIPPL